MPHSSWISADYQYHAICDGIDWAFGVYDALIFIDMDWRQWIWLARGITWQFVFLWISCHYELQYIKPSQSNVSINQLPPSYLDSHMTNQCRLHMEEQKQATLLSRQTYHEHLSRQSYLQQILRAPIAQLLSLTTKRDRHRIQKVDYIWLERH